MKKLTLLLIAGLCFSVSVGALTPQETRQIERAKAFVKSKGLTWGGQGDYGTKGLYTYDQSNSRYYGKAYFGIGGNQVQQSAPVRKPKERIPGWFEIATSRPAEVDTGLTREKLGAPKQSASNKDIRLNAKRRGNRYTKLNIDTKKPLTQQEITTGDWRMVSRDTATSTEYYINSKKEKEASMRKLKTMRKPKGQEGLFGERIPGSKKLKKSAPDNPKRVVRAGVPETKVIAPVRKPKERIQGSKKLKKSAQGKGQKKQEETKKEGSQGRRETNSSQSDNSDKTTQSKDKKVKEPLNPNVVRIGVPETKVIDLAGVQELKDLYSKYEELKSDFEMSQKQADKWEEKYKRQGDLNRQDLRSSAREIKEATHQQMLNRINVLERENEETVRRVKESYEKKLSEVAKSNAGDLGKMSSLRAMSLSELSEWFDNIRNDVMSGKRGKTGKWTWINVVK
jgi:hypothetical protein